MYAIISDKGQQARVQVGDVVRFAYRADAEPGQSITFGDVLLVSNEGEVQTGTPKVDGASVSGEVVGHTKGKKLIVFRFKRRKNVRVKRGHRQKYTDVRITAINA